MSKLSSSSSSFAKNFESFKESVPINKICLVAFNSLLVLICLAYVGVGGWLLNSYNYRPYVETVYYYYRLLGALMVSAGCFGVLLAAMGFVVLFVVCKLNTVMIYLVLLIVLNVFSVATGIVGLTCASIAQNTIYQSLNVDVFYNTDANLLKFVDKIQQGYKCCGLTSSSDWLLMLNPTSLPNSCCASNTDSCVPSDSFQEGCLTAVTRATRLDLGIAGGIALGLALVMVVGVVIAVSLLIELLRDERETKGTYSLDESNNYNF